MGALTKEALADIALGKGGSYSLSRDIIKHTLFDTRYFGTTISDYTFFAQQIGNTWRNSSSKTINETNMSTSGQLPNGQTFLVKKVSVSCISFMAITGVNAHDLAQCFIDVLHSSVFELKIAGRDYDLQVPGSAFLPALAISGEIQTNFPVRVGDSIASGTISLDSTPIFIDQLVNFSVLQRLNNPDSNIVTVLNACATALNTANSVMQVRLEGVLTRAK